MSKKDYSDITNDLEVAVRENNITLVKNELNKNELISIIQDNGKHARYNEYLFWCYGYAIQNFNTDIIDLLIQNNIPYNYTLNYRDMIVPFDTYNDKYMKKLNFNPPINFNDPYNCLFRLTLLNAWKKSLFNESGDGFEHEDNDLSLYKTSESTINNKYNFDFNNQSSLSKYINFFINQNQCDPRIILSIPDTMFDNKCLLYSMFESYCNILMKRNIQSIHQSINNLNKPYIPKELKSIMKSYTQYGKGKTHKYKHTRKLNKKTKRKTLKYVN